MTITVTIKNEGPTAMGVMYYNEARQFKAQTDTLAPGESLTVNVWDGHLPVLLPYGPPTEDAPRLFRSPPATMSPRDPGAEG